MPRLLGSFPHWSITARLAAMTAASILFMVLLAATSRLIARAELIAERTEKGHAMVDGVGVPLPFMVRASDDEELRLEFALDDAATAAPRLMLERLAQQRAA